MAKPKGWRNESRRHALASKGVKTAVDKKPIDKTIENKAFLVKTILSSSKRSSLKNFKNDFVELNISEDFTKDGKETIIHLEVVEPTGKTVWRERKIIERNSQKELLDSWEKANKQYSLSLSQWYSRNK